MSNYIVTYIDYLENIYITYEIPSELYNRLKIRMKESSYLKYELNEKIISAGFFSKYTHAIIIKNERLPF